MDLLDALADRCSLTPDACAIIDGEVRRSFADLRADALVFAGAFAERGIGPGEVVSLQLPNWHEAIALMLATEMAGALLNPIVPIYRDAEVGFILADCGARLLVVPETFRGHDHLAMGQRLAAGRAVAVATVRGRAETALLSGGPSLPEPVRRPPDAARLLMYTSGTTGRAKGVIHSGATLAAELAAMADYWRITGDDVILMASPLTHITGYLCGYELPIRTGASVVLMERWDADAAIELIEKHGVTVMLGATPFLAELVARAEARGRDLPSLRLFPCGGAPVAPELIHRAHRVLSNCLATRIYGSTEAPTITLGVRSRDEALAAAETDGRIVGHEIKLLDAAGDEVPAGAEGEIVTRGPELFIGYLNPADDTGSFTEDGYFRTGDLGRLDAQGMLVITGRKKDLIIRGGENIAPKEIEDVLLAMPEVGEAAVVAMPSARMGETVCAFVVPRAGGMLDEVQLRAAIAAAGLARQKWPEHYVMAETLPKTASGKIRKDLLRAEVAGLAAPV